VTAATIPSRGDAMVEKTRATFNWKIFLAGMIAVIAGYALLTANDITFAPILLVMGYCVLIPVSFL
jgi:hypothetical protein